MFNLIGELVYALIAIAICGYVFLKTKEIYDLTKHKGIRYFRRSFLFFGLGFLTRLIFTGILLSAVVSTPFGFEFEVRGIRPMHEIFEFSILSFALMSYFSLMAIISLTASTFSKKINSLKFDIVSNILAILAALFVTLTRSNGLLLIVELITIFVITLIAFVSHTKKPKSNTIKLYTIYGLLFIFWTINSILIDPKPKIFPIHGLKLVSYVLSIALLFIIAYKVKNKLK